MGLSITPISGGTTLTDSASLRAALSDENGTGVALFDGATNPTFAGSFKSTTALATPSALSATQFTGFASTVSGASLMGYGTTNDVTLMNRAGTVVLGIGPNTTLVNMAGSLAITGAITAVNGITLNAGYLTLPAAGQCYFNGRSTIFSPADGILLLQDNANTSFGRLQLGGTTSSFPSLKRSTTSIQGRLADDSAFCPVQAKLTTDTNAATGLTAGVLAALTNASITIYDASGQAYRVPVII